LSASHQHLADGSAAERRVIAAAGNGSRVAIARLYDAHAETLYRVSYRLSGSATDASDVVQEVFLDLPRTIPSFEGRGSFEGWLKQVATHATLMMMRAKKRRREVPLGEIADTRHGRVEPVGLAGIRLERALARLPERMRVVVVLRQIDGYTHEEIADLLGIKPSASVGRMYKARKRLRQILEA